MVSKQFTAEKDLRSRINDQGVLEGTYNNRLEAESLHTESERNAIKGDWVEIHRIILPAGERAPQVPDDTRRVPLEMRLRGYLLEERAVTGETVRIQTRIGRMVTGVLHDIDPRYGHDFGNPQPELLAIGGELRRIMKS